jgi:DNA primase large subunit
MKNNQIKHDKIAGATLSNIDNLAEKCFPLCMSEIFVTLRNNH